MTDAIPSDHAAVDSFRVEVTTVGSTARSQVILPRELDCEAESFVSVVLDGRQTHAQVDSTLNGDLAIRGAYANKRMARTTDGENLLAAWLGETGLDAPATLVLDVVTEGYGYGLREPGTRVVYDPVEKPESSLSDIADSLE